MQSVDWHLHEGVKSCLCNMHNDVYYTVAMCNISVCQQAGSVTALAHGTELHHTQPDRQMHLDLGPCRDVIAAQYTVFIRATAEACCSNWEHSQTLLQNLREAHVIRG